ncbi:helix-turn-helix domain-containing protein [Streptomyces violaceusniger]|uniref:AraC-like ligand-binding domain-containing protein n=1 Tax=Streptomyces violaceusniger TaxID=68280 RepID=UPI001386A30E
MTELNTETLPAKERFAAWVELANQSFTPTWVHGDDETDFRASMRVLALGDVLVAALAHPSVRVHRTERQIRAFDPGAYVLNLLLEGSAVLRQHGREATLRAGQCALLSTSHPFQGQCRRSPDTVSLILRFPRTRLPQSAQHIDRLTAVTIDVRHGLGAVLTTWLTSLTARARELAPADAPTLAQTTLDLLTALLATLLRADADLSPEARRRALRARIGNHAERHLGDPGLTPQAIADAHHISLSHLHHLLAAEDTTPAAWIRRRRLERCRQDLANPHLRHLTIAAIGRRWGFASNAHFSRAFRSVYGTTPSDHRHTALTGNGMEGSPAGFSAGAAGGAPSPRPFRPGSSRPAGNRS